MRWTRVIACVAALVAVLALWKWGVAGSAFAQPLAGALVIVVVLALAFGAGASIKKRKRRQLQELRDSALW